MVTVGTINLLIKLTSMFNLCKTVHVNTVASTDEPLSVKTCFYFVSPFVPKCLRMIFILTVTLIEG